MHRENRGSLSSQFTPNLNSNSIEGGNLVQFEEKVDTANADEVDWMTMAELSNQDVPDVSTVEVEIPSLPHVEIGADAKRTFLEKYRKLTDRESEVLGLFVSGLTYKEVGSKLSIAKTTVQTHIYSIYEKLGVNSIIRVIHLAYATGILKSNRSGEFSYVLQEKKADTRCIACDERAEKVVGRLDSKTCQTFLDRFRTLSRAEAEVAFMSAEGLSDKEIAAKRICSVKTVKYQLHSIANKTQLSGRRTIAYYMYESGLMFSPRQDHSEV